MPHNARPARPGLRFLSLFAIAFCATAANAERVNLVTYLTTTNEVFPVPPPIPGNAEGIAICTVDTDANIVYYYVQWGALSSEEVPSHIHGDSTPDTLGPILVTLPLGNPKIGQAEYEEVNEAEFLTGRTYLNIHTEQNPLGELRGQLTSLVAIMEGAQEVSPVVSLYMGIGFFMIDREANTLSYYIRDSVPDAMETGAHIHGLAPHGVNGPILHTLPPTSPKIGTWNYPPEYEASILEGMTYLNIHTAAHSGGEIRGQIVNFLNFMDASQESPTPTGAENAFGIGNFSYDRAGKRLGYRVVYQGLSSEETAAHIHGYAPAGMNAGILETLPLGVPKVGFWDFSADAEGDLSETYVNIHTANNTSGEIRGQIPVAHSGDRLLDYLLGRTDSAAALDANGDGAIDVADLVQSFQPTE